MLRYTCRQKHFDTNDVIIHCFVVTELTSSEAVKQMTNQYPTLLLLWAQLVLKSFFHLCSVVPFTGDSNSSILLATAAKFVWHSLAIIWDVRNKIVVNATKRTISFP